MITPIGYALCYAAIVLALVFSMVRNATRRVQYRWQKIVSFALIVAYMILTMVLWLVVLDAVDQRDGVWIVTFLAVQIGAVLVGFLPPAEDATPAQRRKFWTLAATMRRPFYNWERARKQYQEGRA